MQKELNELLEQAFRDGCFMARQSDIGYLEEELLQDVWKLAEAAVAKGGKPVKCISSDHAYAPHVSGTYVLVTEDKGFLGLVDHFFSAKGNEDRFVTEYGLMNLNPPADLIIVPTVPGQQL